VGFDNPHVLGCHSQAEVIKQCGSDPPSLERLADHYAVQMDDILVLMPIADSADDLSFSIQANQVSILF